MTPLVSALLFVGVVYGQTYWNCGGGICPATTVAGVNLVTCARTCLATAPLAALECTYTDCVCNGAHFPRAVQAIYSCGIASCTIPADVASATQVAISFCNAWTATASPAATSILSLDTPTDYPTSPIWTPTASSVSGQTGHPAYTPTSGSQDQSLGGGIISTIVVGTLFGTLVASVAGLLY
ncbi:hypothetical protein JAAARDRAFT_210494 [Jaapia argillacea MUCL 33604]|uniref:Extracellular membrane protein CFEM domain-containing protein n=1 Tax=Jaapia argillacea MUCL 33604 TaxID=933084 RepID=A0A067PML1_9AGAM|nr:hypothetical protein JAAARDRAFT_210494 [Jaapia argillacea MUCL 33604]